MNQDKLKGKTNEIVGKGRQEYGDAMDDPEQRSEGETQEMKGKGQGLMGEAKDKFDDAKDAVKDKFS